MRDKNTEPIWVTWLGQAGYCLRHGKSSLAIDPYFTNAIAGHGFDRLYPPPFQKGGLKVDAIIATHNHGDHLDIETLRDYIGFSTFYGPDSCVAAMRDAGFAPDKLNTLNRGDEAREGPFNLTAVFADHTEDSIGVVVECAGLTMYFTGDSLMNENLFLAAELKPDILFTCINGKFGNMGWQDAVKLAKELNVRAAIPAHYDMFAINSEDPSLFISAFERSPVKSVELVRGESYDIAALIL